MTSKKETETAPAQKPGRRTRRPCLELPRSAEEKAQAVLAIWTDRVKTAEVMRSLGVTYMTLQQWQERAMEGMLQALEPRANLANGAALPPRLRALLRRRQEAMGEDRIKARLERLQPVAPAPAPAQSG